jgi:hypothetical protein
VCVGVCVCARARVCVCEEKILDTGESERENVCDAGKVRMCVMLAR